MTKEYVFLFHQHDIPGGYFYVEGDTLFDVLSSCEYLMRMGYVGRIPLTEVPDVNRIKVESARYERYYLPLALCENYKFRTPPCWRCTTPICGKEFKDGPRILQGRYTRRGGPKRYPGLSGEESEDE